MAKTTTIKDELYYKDEHLNCFLYDSYENPTIAYINKTKGETLYLDENRNRIIFLLKGKINFLYATNQINFEERTFILLPRGCEYTMNIEENSSILIVNMHHKINFCEHFPLEMLYKLNKNIKIDTSVLQPLKINHLISIYLENVTETISAGLKCIYFHEIKQMELFYYLRAYYPKPDLAAFFAPILNDDTAFAEQIYQNYETAKNLSDLAEATYYSISGFKKRFSKVFGIPPHTWIERERAKKIHYDINCTQKPFKEISSKYNFYSLSHFNKFCKKMYGDSPSALRKNVACAVSFEC